MRSSATFIAIFVWATSALAQDSGSKEEQAACQPDVRRLCGKIVKADEQKYRDCLQSHFQELSQKCQQVLVNRKGQQ